MSSLFKHIVVPLDFTEKNNTALKFALRLAKQNGSRVTLLHVIETIEYAEDGELAAFYESLKKQARENLATCGEQFRTAEVPAVEKVVLGKRAPGIVSYALQQDADLIVLSSHKVDLNDNSRGWATLSYQVSILCQCPVMLVK